MPARQSAFPCPVRSRNSSAARRRTQRESRSTCRCGNGLTRATVARATNSISPPSRRRSRRSASTTAGDRRAAVSTQPGPQAAALGQSYPVPTFASVRVEYADGSFREFHVHKPVRADVTISGIVRGLPDLDADLAPRSGRSHPAEHPAFPVPPPAEARCAAAPEVLRSRPPPAAAPRPAAGWQSRRIVRWLRAASWDRKASPDTGEPREPPAMRWRTQSTRRARCGSYPGTVLAPVPAAWRRPWRASAYRSPPRRKTWFQIGPVPPLHCRQTSYPTHCAGHAAGAGAPPESTARHLQTRCSSCDTLFQPRGVRRYGLPLPDWHGDYKGGSLRWIRLEGDPAAVFLDDDAARQRQALTGAAPHLLGGEELFSIAYRMTGSVGDAEDIVQEAFLRLTRVLRDDASIASPKAYLATVTTRLAISYLRSARVRRESYVGAWLPEPLIAGHEPDPAEQAEMSDSLSMAFLVLLESLSPAERAVFLLHEVFGYGYTEIAEITGKSEPNCRQILARARHHVDEGRAGFKGPRFEASREQRDEVARRFFAAAANIAMYKRLRQVVDGADVYHLTAQPAHDDPQGWMAIQYVSKDARPSVVLAYRLGRSDGQRTFKLRGLTAGRYAASEDGRPAGSYTAEELSGRGLPVKLDAEWRAAVIELTAEHRAI